MTFILSINLTFDAQIALTVSLMIATSYTLYKKKVKITKDKKYKSQKPTKDKK